MITEIADLSKRLEDIKLWIESKIQIWATYRDLKPVSSLIISDDATESERLLVFEWIKDANLLFETDDGNRNLINVSKDKSKLKKIMEIMWSTKAEDHIAKGLLFGYPKEAVVEFANNHAAMERGGGENLKFDHFAYIRYKTRTSNPIEDSSAALSWAELSRREIPNIAKEFEDALAKVLGKDKVSS